MIQKEKLCFGPVKMASTRVWRTYLGGKLMEELQGKDAPEDSHFPEDWIASVVTARNPGREALQEGPSKIEMGQEETWFLKDCIAEDPIAWLGESHVARYGANPGVLVKFLDSAERLGIQVHPDREIARKLFHSEYGKTESWYILAVREIDGETPCIYLGFRPGVTRERWKELFEEQDVPGMLECLNRVEVQPGDVYLVKGGIPHAIGAGCFLVETQEPTDYTVRVERVTTKGLRVADVQCHQGVGFEKMFECFAYPQGDDQNPDQWNLEKITLCENENGREVSCIRYSDTPCFALNELEVSHEWKISSNGKFSVLVMTDGEGVLRWNENEMPVRAGEQVFLPAAAQEVTVVNTGETPLKIARSFPPESE